MQKVILPFLIAFVLLMVVIILSRITYNNTQRHGQQAEESRNIINHFSNIDIQLRSAEIFSPTYENTAARGLYQLFEKDMDSLVQNTQQLQDLVKDDSQQKQIADSIAELITRQLPTLQHKNVSEIIATEDIGRFKDLQNAHRLIRKGLENEEQNLIIRRNTLLTSNRQNNTLTLVLAILAIILITVTFFQQFFLRRKSLWLEGFLESILNTTQNGIVHYKALRDQSGIVDFRIGYANKAMEPIFGIHPEKLIGKRLSDVDSYIRTTNIYAKYIQTVETGQPAKFEHLFIEKGLEKWLSVSITKLEDGITVAFHDIGELKRYEEELKKNIVALEQSNRELEEYAYAASHDLQEPLRKIRTFGSFLQDTQYDRLDEKGKQQLEKILQSTERMSLLIKDLLSFSSLQDKDEFRETDLNAILENVLQDMEVMITQKKAIVSHDPLPEIYAIPIQINQLFYNLVNNALKFSKPDVQLHLDVSCKQVNSDDIKDIPGLHPSINYYEIIFSDNGIGFNQDYATHIFGLFKRLNDKSTYAGSGIGLSLCKKVVANHGGVIMANGKEGVGAQFYIYLPVVVTKERVGPLHRE